jgi:hypothetical protein
MTLAILSQTIAIDRFNPFSSLKNSGSLQMDMPIPNTAT